MNPNEPKQNSAARRALAVSIVLLLIWCLLGTHSTLTWFSDQKSAVNTFVYGRVKVEAEYLDTTTQTWKPLEGATELFRYSALYEPGYTQIARLRIKNAGDVPFDYRIAVTAENTSTPVSVLGGAIRLSDYLESGILYADTEEDQSRQLTDRYETRHLMQVFTQTNQYYNPPQPYSRLESGNVVYAALVVYMPEQTGNEANAAGGGIPQVDLGINIRAQQITQ